MDAATPRDLDQLDPQALKALILTLCEQVFSHQKQLASRDAEIEHLKLLIANCVASSSAVRRRSGNTRSNNWNCSWRTWKQGEPKKKQR